VFCSSQIPPGATSILVSKLKARSFSQTIDDASTPTTHRCLPKSQNPPIVFISLATPSDTVPSLPQTKPPLVTTYFFLKKKNIQTDLHSDATMCRSANITYTFYNMYLIFRVTFNTAEYNNQCAVEHIS
jgi:hypothetical protein